jgi:2-hydroxy-6-oxonona-2,4-dienedioate hydrolase
MAPLPPLAHDLPPTALRVLAQATRASTPCGDGELVWHTWGDGAPLVLLHGGSGSWAHWIRNVEAFAAAGWRVVVPDLPGFGDSAQPPTGRDADALVAPIAHWLAAHVASGPCPIVGFSFGGLVAGLLAAAQPQRVSQLVLVGAPGFGLRSSRLQLASWRAAGDQPGRLAAHRSNLATLMLHRSDAIDDLAVALQAANVPRDRMQGRRLAGTDILLRTLPAVRCRVDALYGSEDALYAGRMAQLASCLQAAPALGELVVVEGVGHWLPYEAPQRFNAEVLRLVAASQRNP